MTEKRLATNIDGELTYCSAPADKIGQGRCNHIAHQEVNEDINDFVRRSEDLVNASRKDSADSAQDTEKIKAEFDLIEETIRLEEAIHLEKADIEHFQKKQRENQGSETLVQEYQELIDQHVNNLNSAIVELNYLTKRYK